MNHSSDLNTLILDLLQGEQQRRTPSAIIQHIKAQHPGSESSAIRDALKSLLRQGAIVYSHRYSISQLEINFQRSVRVSPRLSINLFSGGSSETGRRSNEIYLSPGAAFGTGDHPTTRLALKGVDFVLGGTSNRYRSPLWAKKALDIGTGSGVLAIAAAHLGIGSVMAIDNDPVARVEALHNVALNGLQPRVQIMATHTEALGFAPFFLIMANLRPPTLRSLFPIMKTLSEENGYWVLSGFRPENLNDLFGDIEKDSHQIVWQESEGDWSAVVFQANINAEV